MLKKSAERKPIRGSSERDAFTDTCARMVPLAKRNVCISSRRHSRTFNSIISLKGQFTSHNSAGRSLSDTFSLNSSALGPIGNMRDVLFWKARRDICRKMMRNTGVWDRFVHAW